MFTGLVETMGRLASRRAQATGMRFSIEHGYEQLELGESISVSGACLTVAAQRATRFEVDVSPETLDKTTLGTWEVGRAVNLERALALGQRLGGHLVTGHVDGVGEVRGAVADGEMTRISLAVPTPLARYIAGKGSLCVDGVSLTVNDVRDEPGHTLTDLLVIPHTRRETTLGRLELGDRVNLEIDLIARYVERLVPGGLR